MKMFSFRAKEDLIKEAEKLAILGRIDKSIIIREALEKGLVQLKVDFAIKLFSEEKLSVSEAAEIAGISIGEFMEVLVKRGVKVAIDLLDIQEGLDNALKILK